MEEIKDKEVKKRGRKPKGEVKEYILNENQNKFFIDLSEDKEVLVSVHELLKKCNQKNYGREILFKDLVIALLSKLTDKDIERLQENSLSEMEKVQRALDEFNKKNNLNLSLGEFLVKKLNIN